MSGKYIVVFKPSTSEDVINRQADDLAANGGTVHSRYDSVLKGFSATIPDAYLQSLTALQGDIIDYIEPDGIVTTQ
ncbi:peptidase inhibitor I9 [Heterobasidion irregulare TC 32-1]|uniref:Peptidase inhibitor I9 n=1 Tax=Heterobasidion irregulare (strain TC 32-1) TaxID=747525 RepID=W4K5N7_HETIT|nr:peptidase inhibitor I9 [Heterobasidion irregulare TC 32-1]ETW81079.1 peptidase inhibitor I9 [Heterobasidion irregulare TC 32-1]